MKTVRILIFALITAFLVSFGGCVKITWEKHSSEESAGSWMPEETPAETPDGAQCSDSWTVMIYMNGSDLESEGGEATKNLTSLLKADFPRNINVILFTGGTKKWHNGYIDPKHNQIWRLTDGGMELLKSTELKSIGESSTLADFLDFSQASFPADKKALFFWNHGGGSVIGFGADEYFDYDSLCLPEISDAFERSFDGQKFDLIGFDACLMANIETASVLEPYAKYMVASEEVEPGGGWDYENLLGKLAEESCISGEEFGIDIANGYWNKYRGTDCGGMITCSVTDLSKIAPLEELLGTYAVDLSGSIAMKESMKMLADVRQNAESYGDEPDTESFDTIDLYCFIDLQEGIDETLCGRILDAIGEAVVYEKSGNLRDYSCGLSIYLPFEAKDSFDYSLQVYKSIDFCPEYKRFAQDFASMLSDEKLESEVPKYNGQVYDEATGLVMQSGEVGETGSYYVRLTDEQMEYMSYVYCTLGWYQDGGTLIDLGFDSDLTINYNDNTIHDDFEGSWTGLNGQPVAVYVMEETDEYVIYNIPVIYNEERAVIKGAWTWDENNEEGGYYTYLGIYYGSDEHALPNTKLSIDLKMGDAITPIYPTLYSPDGYDGYYIGDTFYAGEKGLSLGLIWLPDGEYDYGFVFFDCYGNRHYSETVDFKLK
jgi:hypothetical protein